MKAKVEGNIAVDLGGCIRRSQRSLPSPIILWSSPENSFIWPENYKNQFCTQIYSWVCLCLPQDTVCVSLLIQSVLPAGKSSKHSPLKSSLLQLNWLGLWRGENQRLTGREIIEERCSRIGEGVPPPAIPPANTGLQTMQPLQSSVSSHKTTCVSNP